MKITKYEHSCMVVEKNGSAIVIDPGAFSTPITDVTGVVAIVITHEHADHWTPEQLNRILERNPGARILGPGGVVAATDDGIAVEQVSNGDVLEIGGFTLAFFGEKHAVIHESIPVVDNVAVLVDDNFYYAGDSYTIPHVPVHTLAVPVGAPWLKIGDVMDYVLAIAPKLSFPVHEAVLSQIGKTMAGERVEKVTLQGGGRFVTLAVTESLDL